MAIYALGDSIAKGVYLNKEGRYIVNKEAMLEKLFKKLELEFRNYSVFGATADKGYELFQRKKRLYLEDSFVFVLFGGNDCNFHWDEVARDPRAIHQPLLSLDFFAQKYESLLEDMKKSGLKPIPITLPPLNHEAFFTFLSQNFSGSTILSWLGESKNIFLWQENYDKKIREIAEKLSLPLLDLRQILLNEDHYSDYICLDGMHLNPQGQSLLSERLLQPIKSILK